MLVAADLSAGMDSSDATESLKLAARGRLMLLVEMTCFCLLSKAYATVEVGRGCSRGWLLSWPGGQNRHAVGHTSSQPSHRDLSVAPLGPADAAS